MATNVTVIHAQDFVKARPDGQLDLEGSKQLLMEIASASAPLGDHKILVDTRRAQVTMSITDLWYLAAELSNFGNAFLRNTAILCPLEKFDQAGFFALCARNRAYPVSAFASFEDAVSGRLPTELRTSHRPRAAPAWADLKFLLLFTCFVFLLRLFRTH
jgi:hypothetical protein